MVRWWRLGVMVTVVGCGSGTVLVGMDAAEDDVMTTVDAAGDVAVDAPDGDAKVDADAGALMCPLRKYVAGEKDECFAVADKVCNPAWPCSDAAVYAYHYQCTVIGTPPFPSKLGVPQCGELDGGGPRDFCCAEQRCVRYQPLDSTCSKTAGHDWNWGCPKLADGGILYPPKYDSGATAICAPNVSQPNANTLMLCCDDVGP